MKPKPEFVLVAALLFLPIGGARAAETELAGALQKGLFEEEANHNLAAAKESYQAVVGKFDEDRKLAATAVFRLGECYRKEGKTAEASQQYERILREFSDQTELVKSSQAALGPRVANAQLASPPAGAGPSAVSEEDAEIQRLTKFLQDSPDMINGDKGKDGMTPLQEAVSKGQTRVAAWLLERKADINLSNDKGTALHIAVFAGNRSLTEFLLSHGANPNAKGPEGRTPLQLAVSKGFKSICELLIQNKADVNARDDNQSTALQLATTPDMVDLLLANKADPDVIALGGSSALSNAVSRGDIAIAKCLLAHGAKVNIPENKLPLACAIECGDKGNKALVELLLDHKADPNLRMGIYTMLDEGVARGDSAIVETLIAHGANVNNGSLFYAVEHQQTPMVELLLKHKADPNGIARGGKPLLIYALLDKKIMDKKNIPIAELLVKYGADVNKGSGGESSLADVFQNSANGYMLDFLLAHGADANLLKWEDNNQSTPSTPLMLAIQLDQKDWVKKLLDYGADPNRRDANGYGPLDRANSRPEMIELLRAHGASEFAPAPGRIIATRKDKDPITFPVFTQDAQGFNRYTLLDALQVFTFKFPDLTRIVIHRTVPGKAKQQEITVNLLKTDGSLDLSKDLLLNFGDVIEIPERSHSLGETDGSLSPQQKEQLASRFKRTVTFKSGTQSREIAVPFPSLNRAIFGVKNGEPFCKELLEFLPSSADFSKVQVTRIDPSSKQKIHYTANLAGPIEQNPVIPQVRSLPKPSVNLPEPHGTDQVWLLEGDVIEIPAS